MLNDVFITINQWMTSGSTIAVLGCFLWGMVSVVLSPCHMASIPLMVSYVAGQNQILQARQAASFALLFTFGLFITIALVGIVCSLLGRMLGEISPYWTIPVGALLLWIALDMLGLARSMMSGQLLSRLRFRGRGGAFLLGLAYGVLSGTCTFGFIAPILAIITVQEKIAVGIVLITVFGIGHCIPIAVAGSFTATVKRLVESERFQQGGKWFRKGAGVVIALIAVYFIVTPFVSTGIQP
ncbi:MAG: sulfite exporter TauE/SafE family protein [Deltaproteobacteria bacterium]|nr:sulfite exporter TauE/SafE family protein [Deltaproteobacteria bacterium]